MKGFGTDERAITNVLGFRTLEQRLAIRNVYKQAYGKELTADLAGELSGNFKAIVLALMRSRPERDAYWLRKAMKGAGTDEDCLVEILCSRDNAEIKAIAQAYTREYERDLEADLASETSGTFKRFMVSLAQAHRPAYDSPIDVAKCRADAKRLYDAGEGRWGVRGARGGGGAAYGGANGGAAHLFPFCLFSFRRARADGRVDVQRRVYGAKPPAAQGHLRRVRAHQQVPD